MMCRSVLVIRCAPVCVVRETIEQLLKEEKKATVDLALQDSVRNESWPEAVNLISLPKGSLNEEILSDLLKRNTYDRIIVPIPRNRIHGYSNVLSPLPNERTDVRFEDGTYKPLTDELTEWSDWNYGKGVNIPAPFSIDEEKAGGQVLMLLHRLTPFDSRVFRHAETLAEQGLTVTIFADPHPGEPSEKNIGEDIRVLRGPYGVPTIPWIYQKVKGELASVVHANDIETLELGHTLAKEWNVPLVLDIHDLWWNQDMKTGDVTPKNKHLSKIADTLHGEPDHIFGATEMLSQVLRGRFDRGITTLRNAPPIKQIPMKESSEPVIGYSGRFVPKTHAGVFLETLKLLPEHVKGKIWPVNSDLTPYREYIHKHALEDRVSFEAPVPPERLRQELSKLWLGFVPAFRWRTLNEYVMVPTRFYDCLAAGLPMVCGNAPELMGLVVNAGVGRVVDEPTPEAFAEQVLELLEEPGQYDRLREGVKQFRRDLCWEKEKRKLLGVYEELQVL